MIHINKYATVLADILLDTETVEITQRDNVKFINGRLKGVGSVMTVVLSANDKSLGFTIMIPSGKRGYRAEILNQYLNEESLTAYAQHAYDEIMSSNNF